MVEDVRPGGQDDLERGRVPLEIGDERLDPGGRAFRADGLDDGREVGRPAVGEVVAGHRRDHGVGQAERGHGLGHATGSSGSGGRGVPLVTAQKPQLRVQVSPRMRNVAVRRSQHSPMFGQRALWQIVCRRPALRISATRKKSPCDGSRTFSQAGFWVAVTPPLSQWTRAFG